VIVKASPARVGDPDARRSVRVVLIEDNPGDVRLIRELLADAAETRFEISHADHLNTGLKLLAEVAPDVVVLDLGLPDSSGLEPVETVHGRAPDLPIIVLTGSHDRMLAVETIRAGAHYCLVKDQVYGGAELSLALRYAIERQQLTAQLQRHTEELELKNGELDAFAYSISHDLKEPVRSVTMFSGFLLEDYAERLDATGREYLERIRNAGSMMGRMIDDVLTLAQVTRQTAPPVRVAVRPVIDEVLERLRGAIDAKGGRVDVAPDLPDVRADAARIGQVFGNLISNGLKFNDGDGPLVQVGSAGVQDGIATFFVRDNGIGIAPEYHDRAFGLFQRLNARERYEGTGAGLSIVKRVVEHYGGQIGVESEAGRGTTFNFTLPAWQGRDVRAAAREEAIDDDD
jgi:signal transduction histidine kinase